MSYRYQRDRDQPRGGAEHLARIHGTEEDRVNCPFYFKIGACRHGDKCSRQHHRPPFSETLIIKHMWNNPLCAVASSGGDLKNVDRSKLQANLDEFYDEIFEELSRFGKVEDIQVCENLGDHMVGNVYVKFADEEEAEKAKENLHGRFYACRQLDVEYCPVTDFKEARCRQFDEGTCQRGPYCNFMHVCEPSNALRRHLQKEFDFGGGRMVWGAPSRGGGGGGGDRDRDRDRRDRDRRRDSRDRDRDRDRRDRERDRSRDRSPDRSRRDRDRDRGDGDRDKERRRRDPSPQARRPDEQER